MLISKHELRKGVNIQKIQHIDTFVTSSVLFNIEFIYFIIARKFYERCCKILKRNNGCSYAFSSKCIYIDQMLGILFIFKL